MAEFLLELRSEEIPARMQVRAGENLRKGLEKGFEDAGLEVRKGRVFTGPRRLVFVADLPAQSPDVCEERKGPRVGSPERALAGFLRAAVLSDISEAEVREDKKGQHYVAMIDKPGRPTPEIITEVVPAVMRDFPWPKSMRSGASDFRWVRPLRGIVALFGGKVVDFEVGGVRSGDTTEGHRQMGPGPFTVAGFEHYRAQLEGPGHVILDHTARVERIRAGAAEATGALSLVEDQALLDENAGLTEWPVVLLGDMKADFLALPEEVIRLTLKSHQKTFTVRGADGAPAPHFLIVANLDAPDGGATIRAGNAKVINARLADAAFFIETDAKTPLAKHAEGLARLAFHDKLGSFADKVERMAALAREIAPAVGADPDLAEQAAQLAKADLVTGTVIEMTSLQGQVGRMMAEREGIDPTVAHAIEDHYKPQGPSDSVPTEPVSVAVALADKLDSLVAFWAIDEKPTGSKDPYALRRAALGVVRIVLENRLSLSLSKALVGHFERLGEQNVGATVQMSFLVVFLLDRLEAYLKGQGYRTDIVRAVRGGDNTDDLLAVFRRIEALADFLSSEAGNDLLAGYKRAANILKPLSHAEAVEVSVPTLDSLSGFSAREAARLHTALSSERYQIDKAVAQDDYPGAFTHLAALRDPINAFFDGVLVNSDDAAERLRRLALLRAVVETFGRIADFGKLEG